MHNDKPTAVDNGWQQLHTEVKVKHRMFNLRNDLVRLPNGTEHYFTYVQKPSGVFILPVTTAGELVLIRQFRYVVDQWLWEIPAGGSDDFDGSDYTVLVQRELHEEIGGLAGEIIPLGQVWGAAGILDQVLYVFLALGVSLDRENHPEETEVIEVKVFPIQQALDILRAGPTDALAGYIALKHEKLLLDITAKQGK
jgi:ADP-ribose pyrophosphatase